MRNILGASTAVLCLGGLLAACGSEDGDGYVATGAADSERAPARAVAPTGDVELVPLDGGGAEGASPGGKGGGSGAPERGGGDSVGKSPGGMAGSGSPAGPDDRDSSTHSAKPGRTSGSSGEPSEGDPGGGASGTPSAPGGGASTQPSGPAKLSVGEPEREPAGDRWCEKVTVAFRNTGGSPVRSGTVTFGTHVIGALGVDWATVPSTEKLPVPIGGGQRVEKRWTVCVEAWRVPLGMHVETLDVSVKWDS
ncbi:hypothetical protein [Streptomyces sp. NPDC048436]|uniref:hypothetical protein n=1 Tax=Streptomyces sp. NPDC048436 TaxID=3365550 RepID=UPI00371CF559